MGVSNGLETPRENAVQTTWAKALAERVADLFGTDSFSKRRRRDLIVAIVPIAS
jgi:hypothetical protein